MQQLLCTSEMCCILWAMEVLISIVGVFLFLWCMLVANNDKKPVPKRPSTTEINEYARKLIQDGQQYVEDIKAMAVKSTSTPTTVVYTPVQTTDDMPRLKNIASTVPNPLEWFVCDRKDLPGPSPAEALIIEALNLYRVKWCREVSFTGLQINKWSYPRYDIMIEVPNRTGIHICEYDGKMAHSTPDRIAIDKLKDQFCHKHGVPITRWNSKHYYKLHECVAELMRQYNIQPKVPGIRVGR